MVATVLDAVPDLVDTASINSNIYEGCSLKRADGGLYVRAADPAGDISGMHAQLWPF